MMHPSISLLVIAVVIVLGIFLYGSKAGTRRKM